MSPNTPLSIAVSATKDKLQASAQDIWSSIRSIDLDEIARKPLDTETPKSVSASLERIENVFKVMFGSCSNGGGVDSPAAAEPSSQPYEDNLQSSSFRRSEFISQKDLGDHVYAQLFMDDQRRATRAVDGLRDQLKNGEATPTCKFSSQQFLHPFPVSSPTRRGRQSIQENLYSNATPPAPLTSRDILIAEDFSFDDGISAISAHTLEEIARVQNEKEKSPNKNGFFNRPVEVMEDITYPLSSRSRRSGGSSARDQTLPPVAPVITPVKLARGRSSGTLASKATRSSRCTRSTNSTQETDFAHVWHKQEQKYWEDVVEQDKKNGNHCMIGTGKLKTRRRSRCGSYSVSFPLSIVYPCAFYIANRVDDSDTIHANFSLFRLPKILLSQPPVPPHTLALNL